MRRSETKARKIQQEPPSNAMITFLQTVTTRVQTRIRIYMPCVLLMFCASAVYGETLLSQQPSSVLNSRSAISTPTDYSAAVTLSVKDFGAMGDDKTDDLAAFQKAVAALQPWQTLYIPSGEYRLSGSWLIKNKYRVKIECNGVIKPLHPYSGYLVEFNNDEGDPLATAIGQQLVVRGLTVDGEWTARGVKISHVWDSSFENLHIWRPFGHGLNTPMLQEVSFYKPVIFMGKPRQSRIEGGEEEITAVAEEWQPNKTYHEGDYVRTAASVYKEGRTYQINEIVRQGKTLYRSLKRGNHSQLPATTPDWWEPIESSYFRATFLPGNINRNPEDRRHDYTTRSLEDSAQFWKPVYADEAAWEMVGIGRGATIDNVKVWNFISRSNANETILRMDNTENSFPVSQVEFHAAQIHAITKQYMRAFNGNQSKVTAYGGSIKQLKHPVLIHAASTTGFKVIGGQLRTANLDQAKGFVAGNNGKSGNAARTFIVGASINGEGKQSVGLSVMPSVRVFKPGQWNEAAFELSMNGAGSMGRSDPERLTTRKEWENFGEARKEKSAN